MKTWIALLRGINMVGRHLLPMKELVALLEGLNARDVKTYRGSGNAVFRHRGKDAGRLAKRISAAVGKEYEFKPLVMMLETEQLGQIIADNPFPEAEAEPRGAGYDFTFVPAFAITNVSGTPESIAMSSAISRW